MEQNDFDSWPLHDAILNKITIDWNQGTCTLDLTLNHPTKTTPIVFKNITGVTIPHKASWGNSNYINEQYSSKNEFVIEMQSGDKIVIMAGEVVLQK